MSNTHPAHTTWLIVYAPRDDSFSLIAEVEAVFDKEHLDLEDKLKFFYNGEEWEGVVKGLGGDDDYDSLKVRMNQLNFERRKKKESFHEDQPRKTRGKGRYQDAMNVLKANRSKSNSNPVPSKNKLTKAEVETRKPKEKESPLSQVLKEVSGSESDNQDLHDSPPSSPMPEDISKIFKKDANQAKRKSKEQDLATLKRLKSAGNNESNGKHEEANTDSSLESLDDMPTDFMSCSETVKLPGSTGTSSRKSVFADQGSAGIQKTSSKSAIEPIKRKSIFGSETSADVYEDSEEDVQKEEQKEKDDKVKRKSKKGRKHDKEEKPKQDEEKSEETKAAERDSVLRWKEGDQDVVLIQGRTKDLADKKFYISTKDLSAAKSKDNATTFAKSLLVAAFTDHALYHYSLSGGQYRAAGRANITQKPALPADVVAVIADVALHRQNVKKWNPQQTKKEILGQLRQKLVDIRPRLKKELGIQ